MKLYIISGVFWLAATICVEGNALLAVALFIIAAAIQWIALRRNDV